MNTNVTCVTRSKQILFHSKELSYNRILSFIFRSTTFPNIKSHMIIHTTPKALKCQFCSAKFRIQSYLNHHNRKHIDYSCDVCHKKFTSGRTLTVSLMALEAIAYAMDFNNKQINNKFYFHHFRHTYMGR